MSTEARKNTESGAELATPLARSEEKPARGSVQEDAVTDSTTTPASTYVPGATPTLVADYAAELEFYRRVLGEAERNADLLYEQRLSMPQRQASSGALRRWVTKLRDLSYTLAWRLIVEASLPKQCSNSKDDSSKRAG